MMKNLSRLLLFFIILGGIQACEKDKVNFALQEISAPTNLGAIFDISQDDTGTVSVTPTAEGASIFEVFFGDVEDETAKEVSPGETITHVYAEGEYTLRIVAIGMTGLTSELVRVVTISFTPPTDLAVDIVISETNPFEITVSPTANNATVFDIYYGDVENEEPTTIMVGESGVHVYTETGDYTVRVVARGAGAAVIEFSEVVTISGATEPMALPITFDNPLVNYVFSTFNGASFEVVDNPDLSGANSEASKVGAITNSGNAFEGGVFNLGTPVDFGSDDKTITMKFWSDVPVPVLLKFEGGVSGERECEVVADHGGTGWEDLSFDFAVDAVKSFIDGTQGVGEPFVPTGQYAAMVIFIDGPGNTAGTFYIDDIEQPTSGGGNCVAEADENIDPALGDINWTFKTNDLAHAFEPFGNISSEIVENPNPTGINTSCNVQNYVKVAGCETWSGVGKGLANAIDLTTSPNKIFAMKVYAQDQVTEVTLRLEFEPFPNVDPAVDIVQTMTKVGEWEELVFDFSAHSDKTFKSIIVYFDRDQPCDDAVYYFDDLRQLASAPCTPEADANIDPALGDINWTFKDGNDAFDAFGNIASSVIENPYVDGTNSSCYVQQYSKTIGCETWSGVGKGLDNSIDYSTQTKKRFSMLVYAEDKTTEVTLRLEFEPFPNVDPAVDIVQTITQVGQWEELIFDFSGHDDKTFKSMIIYFDRDQPCDDAVYYFDEIKQID